MKSSIQTLSKDKNIHIYKKITFSKGVGYKKIEYLYDILVDNKVKETLCHNKKNPAVVVYSNHQIVRIEYWYKGKLNRRFGPSITTFSDKVVTSEMWYNNGVLLKEDEVDNIKKLIDRKKKIMKLRSKKLNG